MTTSSPALGRSRTTTVAPGTTRPDGCDQEGHFKSDVRPVALRRAPTNVTSPRVILRRRVPVPDRRSGVHAGPVTTLRRHVRHRFGPGQLPALPVIGSIPGTVPGRL